VEKSYLGFWGGGERWAVRLVRAYLVAARVREEVVAFGARCCELDLPSTETIARELRMSRTHAEYVRAELRALVLAPEQGQLPAALIHEAADWLMREPTRKPELPHARGGMRSIPAQTRRRAFVRAGLLDDERDLAELLTEREPIRCEEMLGLLPGWSQRRFERTRDDLLRKTTARKCGQLSLTLLHSVVRSELAGLLDDYDLSTPLGGPPEGGRQIPILCENAACESQWGAR
jgi:hypothetical protein